MHIRLRLASMFEDRLMLPIIAMFALVTIFPTDLSATPWACLFLVGMALPLEVFISCLHIYFDLSIYGFHSG